MNAILFWVSPTFRLTGSTINVLEYYIEGLTHNSKLKLYLINGTPSFKRKIQKISNERYIFEKRGWEKAMINIIDIQKYNLPSIEFDTVLIMDYKTINEVKGIIRAKKILVISEKYTDQPEYFLSKDLYNVEYYGEMPFHYKDHNYRMKCLFDRYKPLKDVREGTYINSPHNDDLIYNMDITLFITKYNLPIPFIFKSKTEPEENLFEKFTHYLYYHADKWFDPHPRLFLECIFYNKIISYYNPNEIKDGSWYRYNDIMENGITNRTLNRDDEIIKELI